MFFMRETKNKIKDSVARSDPLWEKRGYGTRAHGFQRLMQFRIRDILLVSSLYDLYLFEEDGRLYELLREEYRGLNLSHAPELTQVSSGEEAMKMVLEETRFDLIIITLHIEDMPAHTFAKLVKGAEVKIPIVLLVYDNRELKEISLYRDTSVFDRVFVWHGDFRLLIAIIKQIEDRLNIEHDTHAIGVQSIILIEDSVRYYSSFLPIIYTEIFKQSRRLISEGVNFQHRFLRMRARPKILLFTNYEEAWDCFSKYKDYILGVISDINFSRKGKADPNAGLIFAKNVKSQHLDIPILLQSRSPENKKKAHEVGASFIQKDSPTLLNELRKFMNDNFGFGDFVFRTPDGSEVGRAENLLMLEEQLHSVPSESIRYHGEKNHFSNWLKARTEFWLAHKLRPSKVSDFPTIDALRQNLIKTLSEYRKIRQVGIITDFDKDSFDPQTGFARIGGGSLGGKARGLSFLNILIYNNNVDNRFDGIKISVPPAIVVGTNIFDQFLDENNLRDFALNSEDDQEITQRFVETQDFPTDVVSQLADWLEIARIPLAIRSSSLLEDSQFQPFAGVYKTFMLPNNNLDPHKRLQELLTAIKRVYASTFYKSAKDYMKFTSYSMEEEKMAVIIQKMVGTFRGSRFYPEFSGVAKSHNFYPIGPQQSADGIVSVALGLGKTVVEGGNCVKFSPKYPKHLPQLFSADEALKNNQHEFYALPIDREAVYENETQETLLEKHGLDIAEKDGTLTHVGSTYSHENNTIYDGISRPGSRLVTFAPILKNNLFPLPEITELLLEIGAWGMGTAVEIEFAVNLSVPQESPKEFNLLQLRPMVLSSETDALKFENLDREKLICMSEKVMGNGVINEIYDIVSVDVDRFDRAKTREIAREINLFNSKLVSLSKPYLLLGMGRWGTLDPWLGIPVKWEQISGARVIVETGLEDIYVEPSQGSHFFHNITSFMVGYFTVSANTEGSFVDWEWLKKQTPCEEKKFTNHFRFEKPINVKMKGQENKGIILKPEV